MRVKIALALSLVGTLAMAKDVGVPHLGLKFMSVVHDKSNSWAPAQGSGYLINVGYESPSIFIQNLRVGVGMYVNGDAGLTDWDSKHNKKYAGGLVSKHGGGSKAVLGTAYIDYTSEYIDLRVGRGELDTPLTKIQASLTPNFYESYMAYIKPLNGLKVTLGHIDKMSMGARAATDFGLIGEGGTTGGAIGPFNVNNPKVKKEQSRFYDMGEVAGVKHTKGRSVVGVSYGGIENFNADFWLYHSYDIATDYYAQLSKKIPLDESLTLGLYAQYLKQKSTGSALAGKKDFDMLGAKIELRGKNWGIYGATNKSGDKKGAKEMGYFNAWGADPAYTSTIFSRNAYRDDVKAYGFGGDYGLLKNLKVMVDYAHYSKSDTKVGALASRKSAWELDVGLNYKPTKELLFRVFNSKRVSEYDGVGGVQRRQDHYRAVVAYAF